MLMQMTPIVAEVPKEVPVSTEAEQKGNQKNDLWTQQLCRMADDIGNRAAGTPQCCHHADQDKYDQNVFSGEDTGAEHRNDLFWRISFFECIGTKEDESGKQSIQGRQLQQKAGCQN